MSGATWFIGDLHFGHLKLATLRGFNNTVEHDMAIIRKWRKEVRQHDVVHVLGDISGGTREGEAHALSILHNLPGRKRLIAGNHDTVASIHPTRSLATEGFRQVFERIGDFATVKVDGVEVLLSHYPYEADHKPESRYMQFRLRDYGMPLIHAHTHSTQRSTPGGRELCVSWEAWGRLANAGDVAQWLKFVEAGANPAPEIPGFEGTLGALNGLTIRRADPA